MCIILKIVGLVEKADKEKVFAAKNLKRAGNEKRRKSIIYHTFNKIYF